MRIVSGPSLLTMPVPRLRAGRRIGRVGLAGLLFAAAVAAQVPDGVGAGGRWDTGRIFTPRGSDAMRSGGAAGSQHDERRSFDISGETRRLDYRLDYAVEPLPATDDGWPPLSAAPVPHGPPGLGQSAAKGRLDWNFNATHRLQLTGSLSHADAQRARPLPAARDGLLRHSRALETAWLADWTDRYSTRIATRGELNDYGLRFRQGPTRTQLRDHVFENRWKLGHHAVTASVRDDSDLLRSDSNARGHHQRTWSLGHVYKRRAHSLDLGLGYMHDSEFGDHATGKLTWDYDIVPQWRLSVMAGSSVQVPTLHSRFSDSDQPEKKQGVALHLDWESEDEALGLAVYRRHVRELVSLAPGSLCQDLADCDTDGRGTQLQGLALSGQRGLGRFDLGGSLELQQPVDADSQLLLPRRATRVLKLDASTRIGPWQVSPKWRLFSRRYGDAAHRSQLAGYGRLDVQASAHFAPAWELMFGVDNVADRHYRLSNSSTGSGRAWRVRLRWVPE